MFPGGATLGSRSTTRVDIAKSDYPNGKFGFKGPTEHTIPNPDTTRTLVCTIERTGGLTGRQTVSFLDFVHDSLQKFQM